MTTASPPAQPPKGIPPKKNRPDQVADLLIEGSVYPDWFSANKQKHRYYVSNLRYVRDNLLTLQTTKVAKYFARAAKVIKKETAWADQYGFDYNASHTHLADTKVDAPKQFGQAVVTIVALEMAAREKKKNVNVYDYLRIIPAMYFVDHLTPDRATELRKHAESMDRSQLQALGQDYLTAGFDEMCRAFAGQKPNHRLIVDLTKGHTVTKQVAEKIVEFVNQYFPANLHVGPVFAAREGGVCGKILGIKRTADEYHLDRRRDVLPPII